MNPRHPNCRSALMSFRMETPKEQVRRLTIEVAVTPWYQPLLVRQRQRRLKQVLVIYREQRERLH